MRVDFFIKRPVFTLVCSLIIVLIGAICIPTLPVAQYPDLAPPQVNVAAIYTGANAQVVEAAVTTPLEQQINGVQGMRAMTSTSSSDGSTNITVTFDVDRDLDIAAVDVQNRVSTALGRLPREVNATGVSVFKNSSAMILAAAMYAENGEYSQLFISNYFDLYMRNALKRIKGVGDVQVFGERRYAMRVWLDPLRLAARRLTAGDVIRALQEQNVQIAAGQVGQQPAQAGQAYQISVRATGRLSEPEEFGRIIVKMGDGGAAVLLQDVGRVELGAEDYSSKLRFNQRDAVGFAITQLANANALEVDRAVRAEIARLAKDFPPGIKCTVAFDPTTAVGESIHEVLTTLFGAIVLVILVIFVFLQDWRSTLIPAMTIPVSLVGTFGFVKAFNFSINTLTLFGITLATGLVVDDAIVVIENIERHMRERRQDARAASAGALGEVAGAVIATSLVLVAVFVPVAFFPGTTGRLYKQFSLTIAFSIILSAFNALTLTPALSALLLRVHGVGGAGENPAARGRLFTPFNRALARLTRGYAASLGRVTRREGLMLAVFAACLALTGLLYRAVPTGFVPAEDQGYLITMAQAPEGASLEYTSDVMREIERAIAADPDVENVFAVAGFSFTGSAGNRAMVFPTLRPIGARRGESHSPAAVLGRLRGALSQITGAQVFAFGPPAIQGAGNVGGFSFELLDPGSHTPQRFAEVTRALAEEANRQPELAGVFSSFTASDPQFVVKIDREKAKSMGVAVSDVAEALQVYMGSAYVGDFDFNARSYRVYAQADQKFRAAPQDIAKFYVRAGRGAMVSLGNLVSVSEGIAPPIISHYNLFRATEIGGSAKPGYSSGQAMAAMERVAKKVLPAGMTYEWAGISWEENQSGNKSLVIFALGVLFVFLVLAAQYESFALPLIILLAVPVAIVGALAAQWARGLVNDVFCQIGLVMLVGLASKNAILIVEFAEQLRAQGRGLVAAAIEAAEIRLRPILMTSFAFILGLLPLVFASGAGQESRHSLGTPVLGGMVASTLLNLYFIPVLYIAFQGARERLAARRTKEAARHA